ncbi:MAG: hypothetical protein AAB554_01010 [Patescibacteria group bacterium]
MRIRLAIAALLAFLSPSPLLAASAGDLVKSPQNPAVYYVGADGKRYVFSNAASYFSWYEDFATVKTVSPEELAELALGGNVTYRPGTRMVKIRTDPKVYAVSKGGVLRHVGSEAVAACLFGANWNVQIDDVPDAFFVDYDLGAPITLCSQYDTGAERVAVPTIGVDKDMEDVPLGALPATPTFSAYAAAASPSAGQEGTLMELRLRTATSARVRQLPVILDAVLGAPASGQGADSDQGGLVRGVNARLNLKDVRWVDAGGRDVFGMISPELDSALDQRQTLEFGGAWDVPAGSDVKLRLVAKFDPELPSGEEYRASIPVARVVIEDASGSSLAFLPKLDLVAPTASVGKMTFEVSAAPVPEEDVRVRGSADVALASFVFRAGSAAVARVRSVSFQSYLDEQEGVAGFRAGADADNGTETRVSDVVSSLRLVDGDGRTVAGPVPMPFDGRPVFSGLDLALPAGTSATYVLRGDLRREAPIEDHDDRLSFDIGDVARDVAVFDALGVRLEAAGAEPNGGTSPRYALTVRKHGGLDFEWTGASGAVVAGREARIGTLDISATHDAFDVPMLTFTSVGAAHVSLASLRVSYQDADGAVRTAASVFSGNDATFSGLSLRVPRGGSVTVAVYGQVSAATGRSVSGERLQIAFPGDRPTVFSSEAEGRTFGEGDFGAATFTRTSAASDLSVRLTEMTASRASATPTGTVARGRTVEVMRFSLTSAPEGASRVKKMTFRLKPSDAAFDGADNDALERWADVDGDAADDNGIVELRRFLASGSEIVGEDVWGSIRYGIVRGGVADMTPQGLASAYGDEGVLEFEFATDAEPLLAAGTTSEFSLSLKTDDFAVMSGVTLEVRLLGGADFVWGDVPDGYYVPRTGDEITGLPVVSPILTTS